MCKNIQLLSWGLAGLLPATTRPLFEEGLALVLRRWTALSLAVEHGWGGPQSAAKAEELYANLLEWFYTCKGAAAPCCVWCSAAVRQAAQVVLHVRSCGPASALLWLPSCLLEWFCTRKECRRRLSLLHRVSALYGICAPGSACSGTTS